MIGVYYIDVWCCLVLELLDCHTPLPDLRSKDSPVFDFPFLLTITTQFHFAVNIILVRRVLIALSHDVVDNAYMKRLYIFDDQEAYIKSLNENIRDLQQAGFDKAFTPSTNVQLSSLLHDTRCRVEDKQPTKI